MKTRRNYQNAAIIILWVVLTVLLSLPYIPSAPTIVWSGYSFVAIWFLLGWRRRDVINNQVKFVASIGMMYCFLLLYGGLSGVIKLTELSADTPKYIKISNVLCNEFIIVFIVALVISPLLISIFNTNYLYASLLVAMPTFCIKPFINFSTITKTCLTIGIHCAAALGVIGATYLSSIVLHRLLKRISPTPA